MVNAVCISTQVGWQEWVVLSVHLQYDEAFRRNLLAGEMAEHTHEIQRDTGERVSNVVFNG